MGVRLLGKVMRVYHFMSKEHALSNMENEWLKVATINSLNDPFEFYVDFRESDSFLPEDNVQRIKDHYNNLTGFLCFSAFFGSPVQWAHYANSHTGICFEFEIDAKNLLEIKYRLEPYIIDVSDSGWREYFVDATLSKYEHWQYEQEYRMVIKLGAKSLVKRDELMFIPFSSFCAPVKVYAGINCSLTQAEVSLLSIKGATVHGVKKSRKEYAIEKA
jgi:hypothetical protein